MPYIKPKVEAYSRGLWLTGAGARDGAFTEIRVRECDIAEFERQLVRAKADLEDMKQQGRAA